MNFWKAPQDRRVLVFVVRAERLWIGGGTAIPDEIRYHLESLTRCHTFNGVIPAEYHKLVLSAHAGADARRQQSSSAVERAHPTSVQRRSGIGSPPQNFRPGRWRRN